MVRWQPVAGADSYVIEKSGTGPNGASYTLLASVPGNVLSYRDEGLVVGQEVSYRIKATAADGTASAYSAPVTGKANTYRTVRIMPLGDSNTFGGGGVEDPETKVSYRRNLGAAIQEAGFSFDFVGTLNSGSSLMVDVDHAGFPGARVGDIASLLQTGGYDDTNSYTKPVNEAGFTAGPYLSDARNNPDIILLHIGTNDASDAENVMQNLNTLLDEVDEYERANNKEVTVVVAKIIQMVCFEDGDPDTNDTWNCLKPNDAQGVLNYNVKLESLVNNRIAEGDNLELVDMQDGAGIAYWWSNVRYDGILGEMDDYRHAAQTGYDKMATVWYNALAPMLASAVVPLPVELVQFRAAAAGQGVRLDWRTASEDENDRFEVERMQEGQSYTRVGTVAGAGNSNRRLDYTFLDGGAPAGLLYYRLKQLDHDGSYTYSKVVAVRKAGAMEPTAMLYPSLTDGRENIRLSANGFAQATPLAITLLDAFGKQVHQQRVNAGAQGEINAIVQFPEPLPEGLYIVKLTSPARTQTFRLLVR
ncbi:SGNH/GDSL hydrolase family protein [Pontibacter actiniarum]|uniref:SGNH/GDSL hydrolase family protein n=1 Tax=Pontibacter actiniarum TaxID=323450 RepID=UPI0004199723|nr:SGNH/GDSL hydrolase family protein [Pontibacter actiniarum]